MNKKTQIRSNYFNYFCSMKRIIILLLLSVTFVTSYSQINWLKPNTGYYEWNGVKADSVMVPALDTLNKAPNGAIAIKGGVFYIKNSGVWVKGSGGNTIYTADDTITSNRTVYGKRRMITFSGLTSFNINSIKGFTTFSINDSASGYPIFYQNNNSSSYQAVFNQYNRPTTWNAFSIFSNATKNTFTLNDTSSVGYGSMYDGALSYGYYDTFSTRRYVRSLGYITSSFLSATSPLNYNSSTGVFTINKANTSTNGYLGYEDWNIFNGKGRVDSIRLVNSGTIHNSPATFTLNGNTGILTQTLATQSAYTVFGRGSGSGTPSFVTLDSNYFAGGWRTAVSGAMLGYANTFTVPDSFKSTNTTPLYSHYLTATNNTKVDAIVARARLTTGTLADGLGAGIRFQTTDSTNTINNMGWIGSNRNANNSNSKIDIYYSAGGTDAQSASFYSTIGLLKPVQLSSSLTMLNTGSKITIATGTNAIVGTSTLSGGTVTVSTSSVTANSIIFLTLQSCTSCGTQYISAKTASTSFTITSTNGSDASTVGWLIIN